MDTAYTIISVCFRIAVIGWILYRSWTMGYKLLAVAAFIFMIRAATDLMPQNVENVVSIFAVAFLAFGLNQVMDDVEKRRKLLA